MGISHRLRPSGIIASLLATCQGLVWSVLTLMGILHYTLVWQPDLSSSFLSTQFWIFSIFLTNPGDAGTGDFIMRGDTMLAFLSVYFVLSVVWMMASLFMLWVVLRKKWVYGRCTFISWGLLTVIISVLDIVSTVLLAFDSYTMYNEYKLYLQDDGWSIFFPYSMVTAVINMMTFAARAYVLLIANAIFAILFIIWGCTINEDISNDQPKRKFINGVPQEQ